MGTPRTAATHRCPAARQPRPHPPRTEKATAGQAASSPPWPDPARRAWRSMRHYSGHPAHAGEPQTVAQSSAPQPTKDKSLFQHRPVTQVRTIPTDAGCHFKRVPVSIKRDDPDRNTRVVARSSTTAPAAPAGSPTRRPADRQPGPRHQRRNQHQRRSCDQHRPVKCPASRPAAPQATMGPCHRPAPATPRRSPRM